MCGRCVCSCRTSHTNWATVVSPTPTSHSSTISPHWPPAPHLQGRGAPLTTLLISYRDELRILDNWQSNLTDSHQPAWGGGAQGQKSSSSHGRVSRDSHLSDKQWDCLKMTEDDVLVGEEFQVIKILLIFWVNDSGQKSSLQILQASTIQSWDILNWISTHPR